jgi:hypothetical protein
MRAWAVAAVICVVSGCAPMGGSAADWSLIGGYSIGRSSVSAPPKGWYKKDAPAQEYAQVTFDCLQVSQNGQSMANVDVTAYGGGVPSKAPPNPDLVNACMNAHGFYMMKEDLGLKAYNECLRRTLGTMYCGKAR